MALVRVKRRLDDEPAEILVVACKRIRSSSENTTENFSGTFTFAGTLESKDKLESTDIAKVLKNPRHCDPKSRVVNILDRTRKDFHKAKKNNRLKLVNSFRPQLESDLSLCVFDVEDAGEVIDDDDLTTVPSLLDCSSSKICCNDTELIRENTCTESQTFVYDLYYTSDFIDDGVILDQTFNIEQYMNPSTADYRGESPEREASDDADSNEEDYYKNDYPEEDSDFETNRPYWRDYDEDGVCDLLKSTQLSRLDSSDEDGDVYSEPRLSKKGIQLQGDRFARFKTKTMKEEFEETDE